MTLSWGFTMGNTVLYGILGIELEWLHASLNSCTVSLNPIGHTCMTRIQMAVLSGITLENGNEQFWGLDLWHHTWKASAQLLSHTHTDPYILLYLES